MPFINNSFIPYDRNKMSLIPVGQEEENDNIMWMKTNTETTL